MARRLVQVVLAAAGVAAVAVLARPVDPRAPEPFEIERGTASPTASPVASTEPTGTPTTAEATGEPQPVSAPRAVVHAFDPTTLEPVAEPLELEMSRPGAVHTDISPGGEHLLVLSEPAFPSQHGELRLYDARRLELATVVATPPGVTFPRFSPDSRSVVWMDLSKQGETVLGGLRLGADGSPEFLRDVPVPSGVVHHWVQPLHGGRVGVNGYDLAPEADGDGDGRSGPPSTGPVRLLVADLSTGRIDLDVVLPTADGSVRLDDGSGAWRERQAGVAWDAARDRAYVAHADRDAVLVVDLATGEVEAELGSPAPVLASGAAEGRWREATLSDAGDLLYVHGRVIELPRSSGDHQAGPGERALPVLVVDLDAGTLAHGAESRGRLLAASPGGEHVAVADDLAGGDGPQVLRLHDGRTLDLLWERPTGVALDAAFLPGGEHLLVFSLDDLGEIRHRGNGWAVGGGRGRLDAVDLADGEIRQSVRFQGEWWDVRLRAGIVVEVHLE